MQVAPNPVRYPLIPHIFSHLEKPENRVFPESHI